MYSFVSTTIMVLLILSLHQSYLLQETELAKTSTFTIEAETLSFERARMEQKIDAVIEEELKEAVLHETSPEKVKERVNSAILKALEEQKEYSAVTVRLPSRNTLHQASRVMIIDVGNAPIQAEYVITADTMHTRLNAPHAALEFFLPQGYTIQTTVAP